MIQSPMQICRERKLETLAVVFALILALLVPGMLGLAALLGGSTASSWLQAYEPIVYLEAGVDDDAAEALRAEVEGWSTVASARIRGPKEAHAALADRLGEETVQGLGVAPGMLPTSLVLEPAAPVAGHIDLVSRVSALEARMEVDAVDVPSSGALRVLVLVGIAWAAAIGLGLLGLLACAVLLFDYLRRLREAEDDLLAVLEVFGASPGSLRRPTIVRGAVLGLWAGAGVSGVLVTSVLLWQSYAPALLGVEAVAAVGAWPLAIAPLLVGPVFGTVVGMAAAGVLHRRRKVAPRALLAY